MPDEIIHRLAGTSQPGFGGDGGPAVAALLNGLIKLLANSRVAVVLSGGNVNLDQLRGLTWN